MRRGDLRLDEHTLAALNRRVRLRRAALIVRRNILVFRSARTALLSGMVEPIVYLLTLGVLLDRLVGDLTVDGRQVDYLGYAGPGLLAATTMTVVVNESIANLFYKLKLSRAYEAVLATPISGVDIVLGELGWTLARATLYATPFLVLLVALDGAPAASVPLVLLTVVLESTAIAAAGVVVATFLNTWQQRDLVQLFVIPLFYLSGVLFPVETYPGALAQLAEASPVLHAARLMRLATGAESVAWPVVSIGYFGVLLLGGVWIASRRIEEMFRG